MHQNQPYPKALYHQTKEAVVVHDEAAHKALGPGWHESPVSVEPERAAAEVKAPKKGR